MQGKIQKGSADFELLQDLFKFWQKYYIPEERDEWWFEMNDEGLEIAKKYKGTDLEGFPELLFNVVVEVNDRRFRNAKKKNSL